MVKDIVPRPHMADRLADLMGLSAEDLLQLTESYTLGYFIRNGEKEIIEKIAKSHHKDKSAFDLCMEKKNLGPILAYLLSQPISDPETTIQGLLTHVDPSFGEISIDELFRTEPIAVAVELLKGLADAGDNRQRAAVVWTRSASGIVDDGADLLHSSIMPFASWRLSCLLAGQAWMLRRQPLRNWLPASSKSTR